MSIDKNQKAYIRIDGSGRDVAGSLLLRNKMPGNGKWREVVAYQCCNFTTTTTTTQAVVIVSGQSGNLNGTNSEICNAIGQVYGTIYMSLATPNVIAVGDTLYTDAAGTTPSVGSAGTWKVLVTPNLTYYAAEWDANGVVVNVSLC